MGSQPPPSPLRLAILMADTPLQETASRFKTYGGVFTHLFTRAVAPDPLPAHLALTAHDIVADVTAYPPLDAVDALLITGSRFNSFDDDAWIVALVAYTAAALASGRVRVVGVCFGHQIVGRALGAPVARSPGGWEVSVTDVGLSEKGREVFGMDKMRIHQMHRDAVFEYPEGAIPLAETEVCPVQGMLIPGKVITVQGHPEFTEEIVREILHMRHDAGILTDEIYKSGMDRVANEHDGVDVARAFLRFLRE